MFTPLGNRVLVERLPEETMTEGGLYVPTGYERKASEGYVRGIGPDVKHISVDEHIMFAKYSGSDFESMGKDFLILTEDDVMGKINE